MEESGVISKSIQTADLLSMTSFFTRYLLTLAALRTGSRDAGIQGPLLFVMPIDVCVL